LRAPQRISSFRIFSKQFRHSDLLDLAYSICSIGQPAGSGVVPTTAAAAAAPAPPSFSRIFSWSSNRMPENPSNSAGAVAGNPFSQKQSKWNQFGWSPSNWTEVRDGAGQEA